jgi:hypothetical protein
MKQEPDGEALWKKIKEYERRNELWNRATEHHLRYPPDSYLELASSAKTWRELEQERPDWRGPLEDVEREIKRLFQPSESNALSKYGDIREALQFQNRLKVAAELEERCKRASREKDYAFFRRYSKALTIPDDKITLTPKPEGLVLIAWRELGGLVWSDLDDFVSSSTASKKYRIRAWIEESYKKAGLKIFTEITWKRTWEDPFISALLRG